MGWWWVRPLLALHGFGVCAAIGFALGDAALLGIGAAVAATCFLPRAVLDALSLVLDLLRAVLFVFGE